MGRYKACGGGEIIQLRSVLVWGFLHVFPASGKRQVEPVSEKLVQSKCDSTVLQILQKWECKGYQEMLWSLIPHLNKTSEHNTPSPVEDTFFFVGQLRVVLYTAQ